jgi:hypothetical protein
MSFNFDMSDAFEQNQQDAGKFEALPVDNYPVVVDNAELKQFGSGNHGISLQLSVIGGGKYDGRKLFDNFMLAYADGTEMLWRDPKTGQDKNIGKLTYARVMAAAGLTPQQGDPVNLIGKMMIVKTKMDTNSNGDPEAKPASYKAYATTASVAAPAQTAQAAPNPFGKPNPFAKK